MRGKILPVWIEVVPRGFILDPGSDGLWVEEGCGKEVIPSESIV